MASKNVELQNNMSANSLVLFQIKLICNHQCCNALKLSLILQYILIQFKSGGMNCSDLKEFLGQENCQKGKLGKLPNPSCNQIMDYWKIEVEYEMQCQQNSTLQGSVQEVLSKPPTNITNSVPSAEYQLMPELLSKELNQTLKYDQSTCISQTMMVLRFQRKYKESTKRKSHPTKNFLTSFKKAHENYLIQHCGSVAQQNAVFKRIRAKNNISLQDYENLYNVQEFNQALREFFQDKHLYRALITSRISCQQRKIYLKYLYRFQQAFFEKKFPNIGNLQQNDLN